jgi:hypothetical protein
VHVALRAEFRPLVAPVAILAAALLALWVGPGLPPSLAGLKEAGAYFVLLAGAGMGLWFNRGRAFVAAASLFLAYAGYRMALDFGAGTFAARAVYTAAVVLVPLNILVALLLPERGVSYHGDYRWLFIVAGELMLVAWVASSGRSALSGTAWQEMLDHWLLRSPPAPFLGRLLFCAAFIAAVWRALPPKSSKEGGPVSPIAVGLAGALAAFLIACEWPASASEGRAGHDSLCTRESRRFSGSPVFTAGLRAGRCLVAQASLSPRCHPRSPLAHTRQISSAPHPGRADPGRHGPPLDGFGLRQPRLRLLDERVQRVDGRDRGSPRLGARRRRVDRARGADHPGHLPSLRDSRRRPHARRDRLQRVDAAGQ